jgi:hypothetical protein
MVPTGTDTGALAWAIAVVLDGDGAWRDLSPGKRTGNRLTCSFVPGGKHLGNP